MAHGHFVKVYTSADDEHEQRHFAHHPYQRRELNIAAARETAENPSREDA